MFLVFSQNFELIFVFELNFNHMNIAFVRGIMSFQKRSNKKFPRELQVENIFGFLIFDSVAISYRTLDWSSRIANIFSPLLLRKKRNRRIVGRTPSCPHLQFFPTLKYLHICKFSTVTQSEAL